jgi:hypothetical protein
MTSIMSTKLTAADGFLLSMRHEFDWYIEQLRGSSNYPLPTLADRIHPMFTLDRWATGPGQHTSQIYARMRPALQLVSLWLTGDFPLLWFSYLTFGERRTNSAGQTYIVPSPYSFTLAALEIVKANLLEFAKTIAFMFAPKGCPEQHARY